MSSEETSFITGTPGDIEEADCPNAKNPRNYRKTSEWNKNLVISAKELREIFLFGIDLSDDDGNVMPDTLLEFYIRGAQDWLERSLGGISLTPITVLEDKDYIMKTLGDPLTDALCRFCGALV